jgi:hypothetical protein
MTTRLKLFPIAVVTLLLYVIPAFGQNVAVKTNLLGWAAGGTINAGLEFATSQKVTFQVFGALNPWDFSDDKRAHVWSVEPEVRYWFCQKFNGHFVGFHLLGGEYNIRNIDVPFSTLPKQEIKGRHYEGWYVGAGLTYGYQWILSKHWNFEASIGIGYARSPYKLCGRCQKTLNDDVRHYVGPTKVATSLIYSF